MRANKDLLFSCFIDDPKGVTVLQNSVKGLLLLEPHILVTYSDRSQASKLVRQPNICPYLMSRFTADHAYTVLSAVEFRGKRFLKIRNPWGASEWTGRWSDGSKEWSDEWLDALKALKHTFGVSLVHMDCFQVKALIAIQ